MDFRRTGLTYGRSRISAMLGDVWSDVGNMSYESLSTSALGSLDGFHTRGGTEVDSFERSANSINAGF